MGGIILEYVPVAQQPSLSLEESVVECAVGLGPTSGELLMHSLTMMPDG